MATIKLQNGNVVLKNGKASCECCDTCPIPNDVPNINFVTSGIIVGGAQCVTTYFNGSWKAKRRVDDDDPSFTYCYADFSASEVPTYPYPYDFPATDVPYTISCTPTNDGFGNILCLDPCYTNNVDIRIAQFPKGPTPADGFFVWIRFRSYRTNVARVFFQHISDGKLEIGKVYANQQPYGGQCTLSW
jgi:hypothetical protein